MNKQIKELYGKLLIIVLGLWVSSIVLLALQIGSNVSKIFVFLLGYVLIACVIEYKNMIKRKVENFSVCLTAVAVVSCFFYLSYLGFMLGRVFVRYCF